MELYEIHEVVKKITFLNYKFSVKEEFGRLCFAIDMLAPDTRERETVISIQHNRYGVDYMFFKTPQDVVDYIWRFVNQTLLHEGGELFLVDGLDPFNEHEPSNTKWGMINQMVNVEVKR